jgi:glycosyltransferase involved in cell wall biosynthesis
MENTERKYPIVSIVIPCRGFDDYTQRCIIYCNDINYPNKELIIATDLVCPGLPAIKRNWAIERAEGEIIAFIDSDAYPAKDWLTLAVAQLQFHRVAAVCGPGVLPYNAPLLEQATDLVLRFLPCSYRVIPKQPRVVSEFPTFNLIVWKKYCVPFKPYLTGEDTLFCEEIRKKGFIIYSPDILVYHNRRPLFKPYWKQIGTYGKHRGHLIRLALLGWLSTWWVYTRSFICGFCTCRIATHSKGKEKKQ